jgi:ATP-binding cassette subfamily B protein
MFLCTNVGGCTLPKAELAKILRGRVHAARRILLAAATSTPNGICAMGCTLPPMQHLKALRPYLWKYRRRLAAGIFFIVVSNYFAIMAPQITAYVVDAVQQLLPGAVAKTPARQTDPLVNLFIDWAEGLQWSFSGLVALCGVTILILALVRGVFMFLMRQTIIVMSRHIEFDLKNTVYSHYQTLDAGFYKSHSVGDLMNRISEDVSRVRMYAGPAIMYLINLTTIILFAVYNMLAKDVTLTLYTLAPLPLLAITIYYVNTLIHKKSEKIQALLSDITTNAQQSYSGIRVIKSYVQEKAMLGFFEANSEAYRQNAIGLARVEAIYFPSNLLLIGVSTLVTIMMGGLYFLQGNISDVGIIVEFVLYINMLTFPVSAIGWVASMIQRASASQKRLNEFLQQQPTVVDGAYEPPADIVKTQVGIVFDGVSFTYPHTGITAIKQFSLTVQPGQRIAIIGKSGSGKSTLGQLLMRMYDPGEGRISFDGIDIKTMRLHHLRSMISYVPQDVFLFSETVEKNISFGNDGATRAQVEAAAAMAAVDGEIAKFEHQYDTVVGERGVTLSGGQKQRISIARALLKPSPILVFDDCLSAVDAATERTILQQFNSFLKEKTAIIITHRIFALINFDHIVVLDDGRIVEQGTHTSLLQAGGAYAELYWLQQEESPLSV